MITFKSAYGLKQLSATDPAYVVILIIKDNDFWNIPMTKETENDFKGHVGRFITLFPNFMWGLMV